jgi:hypothetical protein
VSGERGTSVWEWQTSTGVFERDVTDEQLRRLEAPDLQIVEFTSAHTGRWIADSRASAPSAPAKSKPSSADAGSNRIKRLWKRLRP